MAQCSEGYQSKQDALVAASKSPKDPKRKGGIAKAYRLKAYRCMCGLWHLAERVRG